MKIIQFVAESLGDASYVVISGAVAAVIDPQRDVRPFVAAARQHGAEIRYVFETHVHNDYLSGGCELAALGANIIAPAGSGLQVPHTPAADGDEFAVGAARIRAIAAPGHTYEHTAYLAVDEDGATLGAFTGGALLVGSAGRSDLLGPGDAEELTRLQWQSTHRIAALLAPASQIMPTHGAGSFCSSTAVGAQRMSTLADELVANPALAAAGFDAFRALHLSQAAPIPGYYRRMAPINREGPRVYGEPPHPARLTPDIVDALDPARTPLVDVRARAAYVRGHVPSSLLIEESGSMLAYAGWLLPFNAPLALVVEDTGQAHRVTADLFRIGYEDVRGYLPVADWVAASRPLASMPAVSPAAVRDALRAGAQPVIDVRFAYEHAARPLPGARQLPVDRLPEWAPSLPPGPAIIVCASGERAAMAASFLGAHGHAVTPLVDGGAETVLALGLQASA
jgi:glyoxylase-like metal-dependent hydrolase (beta-lactamase superfamily II)/rhodanese-related sulfurtransferase